MADVTLPGGGGRDRGQVVLLSGLLVAVALVVLVVLLNSAIYAQNLATRSTGPGAGDAIEYQNAVVANAGEIVERENAKLYAAYASVESNVTASLSRLDALLHRRYVDAGTVADLSVADTTEGKLVRQTNESRNFTSADDAPDWTLATDVARTRSFVLHVDRSALSTTRSGAFRVVVDEAGTAEEWTATVYNDSGDVTVAVGGTDVCSVAAAEATVNLSAGTLAGEPCPGFEWASGVDSRYDLRFRNGTEAVGTYDLTVNVEGSAEVTGSLATGPTSADPYAVPAVYGVTVEVYFGTARLTYADTVRVAPGEPA